MTEVLLSEKDIIKASSEGFDKFLDTIVDAIYKAVGGNLTAESMSKLNTEQLTLLAYKIIQEEVMDGGFIQLIHNGYGGFIFNNPFGKVIRSWGLGDLATLINKAKKYFIKYKNRIETDCSDDEFMAMYELMPEFDGVDDCFVENEEHWTMMLAYHVDENIESFVKILK